MKSISKDEMIRGVEELLLGYAIDGDGKKVAKLVAQKSVLLNHLYEDLGFKGRDEMAIFMKKHFPNLAKKKPKNQRWKKFIFDSLGFQAPACEVCPDIDRCTTATECSCT